MFVREGINNAVQGDAVLNGQRIIEFPAAFHKITDQVANGHIRVVEGKICVREIVDGECLL
jgi:hypothetical protein